VTCTKLAIRSGQRCKKRPARGSRLCSFHLREAQGKLNQHPNGQIGAVAGQIKAEAQAKGAELEEDYESTLAKKRGQRKGSATDLVVSDQARSALARLGVPLSAHEKIDPKAALLDTLRAAIRQREVWEYMLASIPPEDWQYVGQVPIPGSMSTAKGARIEQIQKNLANATAQQGKVAKMALDAGIDERLVRLAEEQSALIADTIKVSLIAALRSLALPNEAAMIEMALAAAATQLRTLAEASLGPNAGQGEIYDGIANVVSVKQIGSGT
jgi:hypothetical protein